MITQAMILSAGKGTRMRPLTLTTPKPLVMVAQKPLMVWHIERLRQVGITDITLNVGHLGGVIIDFFDGRDFGVNIHISDESVLPEPLETAGGIRHALAHQKLRDEPFLLINGDVWSEFGFDRLTHHRLGDDLAHLMLTANPAHNLTGDFALIDVSAEGLGRVALHDDNGNNHTFAGISVMSPKMVADVGVAEIAPLAPLLRSAMIQGRVSGEMLNDKWVDVGTIERLHEVERYVQGV